MVGNHLLWWGIGAMVVLFIVAQFFQSPVRALWWCVKSAVFGCALILVANWAGAYFHMHIPFNAVTALTAGVLGLPGLAALISMELWILPV